MVCGAGVIGITTAYELAERGHQVSVVDRRDGPAAETSFANGGQISPGHADPWASPANLGRMLGWLGRADAPLRYRLRRDPALWEWTLRFLGNCRSAAQAHNTELVPDAELRDAIFGRIRDERLAAISALLKISGEADLLASNPLLARSIRNRFPYIDPLNHLQVELLKLHRGHSVDPKVLRGLQLTINGISAGLRNSG